MNQNFARRRRGLQRPQNGNEVNIPPQNRGRGGRADHTPSRTWVIKLLGLGLCLLLTSLAIWGQFYKRDPYELTMDPYTKIKSHENITTAQGILLKTLAIFEGLGNLQNATETYKTNGIMATFLRSKYQSAVEKLSGLGALIHKYEVMERTVSPEQFINSSQHQLDDVMTYLVEELEGDEFAAVLKQDGEMVTELFASIKKSFRSFSFLQEAASDPLLLKERIYVVPVAAIGKNDEQFEVIKNQILAKYDLSVALNAVSGLIKILEERDKWVEELRLVDLKYGIRAAANSGRRDELDIPEAGLLWMKEIHDGLDEWEEAKEKYLKKHGHAIQSLLPHHKKIWEGLQKLRKETQIQADIRNKYIQMRKEIHDDVDRLRRRLEKL